MKRCINCGTKNPSDASYCKSCGDDLSNNSSGGNQQLEDEDSGETGTQVWGDQEAKEEAKEFLSMKEQLLTWLNEDNREYDVSEQPELNWLIQLKHGNRVVILGNPKKNEKRLEVVYKLNVSDEHKKILKKLNDKQKSGFEKSLVMMLAEDSNIYNIQRDDEKLPDSILIKNHLYEEELEKRKFFETVQYVVNIGMRATMHFKSLGEANIRDQEEVSLNKSGPSIYR